MAPSQCTRGHQMRRPAFLRQRRSPHTECSSPRWRTRRTDAAAGTGSTRRSHREWPTSEDHGGRATRPRRRRIGTARCRPPRAGPATAATRLAPRAESPIGHDREPPPGPSTYCVTAQSTTCGGAPTTSVGDPHAVRGHDRHVLPAAPVVHGGELDVGHPFSAVIAQTPRVLNSGPPSSVVLDLYRPGRIEAAFFNHAYDVHGQRLSGDGA